MKKQDINTNEKGYTLVESLIYVALLALITVIIITIIIQLIGLKVRIDAMSLINKDVTTLFDSLGESIRNADSFSLPNEHSLRITKDGLTREYSLTGSKIVITEGENSYPLTSDLVQIKDIDFSDWTSVNSNDLIHVQINLTRGPISDQFETSFHKR